MPDNEYAPLVIIAAYLMPEFGVRVATYTIVFQELDEDKAMAVIANILERKGVSIWNIDAMPLDDYVNALNDESIKEVFGRMMQGVVQAAKLQGIDL